LVLGSIQPNNQKTMKKIFVLAFGLVMTLGFAQDANAWWWKKYEVDCKAKLTTSVTIGEGNKLASVSVGFEETWDGKKNVCRDGDEWCWASDCR
jgi:hypothetical protein